MKLIKCVWLVPVNLLSAWLLIAGFYQSMEMYLWVQTHYEKVEQVAQAAENPLSLLRRAE